MIWPDKIKLWASAARDILALMFTPVVTVLVVWLICILAYGAWAAETETQRINYLGAVAILLAILIGLGGQWFQRNRLDKLKFTGPGGFGGEVETEAESEAATVTTTTTTEIQTPEKP